MIENGYGETFLTWWDQDQWAYMADSIGAERVEPRGIEPLTSALPGRITISYPVLLCRGLWRKQAGNPRSHRVGFLLRTILSRLQYGCSSLVPSPRAYRYGFAYSYSQNDTLMCDHELGQESRLTLQEADLEFEDLECELKAEVSGQIPPVTVDKVLRWKWKTLRKPKRMRTVSEVMDREEWYEEERLRIRAISFAAAALCLSADLSLKNLEKSNHHDLTEIILSWHTLISNLISAVDDTVDEASKLLAGRKGTN